LTQFGDFFIVLYHDEVKVDVFKRDGLRLESYQIEEYFARNALRVRSLDHLKLPRLDWSDRYVDMVQQFKKVIPKKFILSGSFSEIHKQEQSSFVMLFDRIHRGNSKVKVFKPHHSIGCISYGPYDNGHILVGLAQGSIVAFDGVTMETVFSVQVFDGRPVSRICFEPAQLILAACEDLQEVAAISVMQERVHYMYADLGKQRFCTVMVNGKKRDKSAPAESKRSSPRLQKSPERRK